VIRTGEPELYPNVPDSLLVESAEDPEQLEVLRSVGITSAMATPLTARGRTFGAITFVMAESGRHFGEADLALAMDLARRAAQAVDNARLYQERAHVARTLQRSLLPRRIPEIPGIEMAAVYNAAGEGNEVGGDFYDLFEAESGVWFFVVGDVQGKGPEAAAVTGLARYTIRTAAMDERVPSEILTILNEALMRADTDRFCTVACCRMDLKHDPPQLSVSCGGHPPPMVARAAGEVETVDSKGDLLGIFPDVILTDHQLELMPGDTLVMFTDGVTERHGEQGAFGEDRLVAVVSSCSGFDAQSIAERIERSVLTFRPESPRDDVAILVARRVGPGLANHRQGV
jgi:serine phosphatase RsbU (regulator of sigma subunit)